MLSLKDLYDQICQLVESSPTIRLTSGSDFPGIERDVTVVKTAEFKDGPIQRLELNITTPAARPHFKWLAEIILDNGGPDFKRYLIKDDYELWRVQFKEFSAPEAKEIQQLKLLISAY